MKKKIVFAVATGFFAVAPCLIWLLQSNKAGMFMVLLPCGAGAEEVEEDKEEGIYHKGTTGTNWKAYALDVYLDQCI